jgi:hypothetical protein
MSRKKRAALLKAVASGLAAVALTATAAAGGSHVASVVPGNPGGCVVVSLR